MKHMSEIYDQGWEKVCQFVNASLVFLDGPAAESLHWHGGLNRLLDSGAVGVRNFSIFEKVSPAYRKATFVLTSALTDAVLQVLMVLLQSNNFSHCRLITTSYASNSKPDKDQMIIGLKTQLLSWMGDMNYIVDVVHIPVFGLMLLDNIFIIPSLVNNFPPVMSECFDNEVIDNKKESGLKSLPEAKQISVKMLSSHLHSVLESLQLKGDIFSLGPLSHIVGAELENLCHPSRKKAYPQKASVLLLDRSLDLAGPLSQCTETVISRMLRLLPHLSGHVCDVQVCMSPLSTCRSDDVFDRPLLAPGCLAHKDNSTASDNLLNIFTKKAKEAVMEINRKIVQTGVKDGLTLDPNASAPKMLKKRILSYREHPDLLRKSSGLLQQALGAVEVMEHPKGSHLDNLLATEKLLVQNFASSKRGVVKDIERLIETRKERGYSMTDILTLVAFLYSLSDENIIDIESESAMQATIMEALFQEDTDTVELVKEIAGDDANDQDIMIAVKTMFEIFRQFPAFRKGFKKHKSIFSSSDPALPAFYVPLLKQILGNIYESADMPDMEFHSVGLRDYIKTGFSLFMNVAKPQLKDNPVIIMFVIGGITASEIKLVYDMALRNKSPKILIGSTHLLSPENTMKSLFHVVKNQSSVKVFDDVKDFY